MQDATMLPKLTDTTQTISFSEGDGVSTAEVFSNDVVITTTAGSHKHGSSKMKLKSLVDYNWEPKFYSGQLLATHMSGKYLAYSIKAPNTVNPGTWNGMVRVVYNPEPGTDRRALIKGMKGEVQDLSFAHIENQVMIACIDEQGNFYVHEVEVTDNGLRCSLVAEVLEDTGVGGSSHRVVWCPYIPDEDDEVDDDVARLLLTTHANTARIWNMRLVGARLAGAGGASCGARALAEAGGAACSTSEHAAHILDAAFSPDGTALATAAADGYVMFFQVYTNNENTPRCLHKWQPHGGKPLSSLFFLDNHHNYNTDVQFWKYAVTGAENNTILKIWSCKSWSCIQTITFATGLGGDTTLGLKAAVDSRARYVVASELRSRALYVLQLAPGSAHCAAISEFLLPYPVLSFILLPEEEVVKCNSSCGDPFNRNGSSGDMGVSPADYDVHPDESISESMGACACAESVRLRLYIVQPKGLQEATLSYSPLAAPAASPAPPGAAADDDALQDLGDLTLDDEEAGPAEGGSGIASSVLQQQSQQLKNLLMRSQVGCSTTSIALTQSSNLIVQRSDSPSSLPQLNLMTPDAFSSPGKREDDDPPLSATPDVSASQRQSLVNTSYQGAEPSEHASEQKFTSGGSSPSREVQEIMSLSDGDFYKEEPAAAPAPAAAALPNGDAPDTEPVLPHSNAETTWPQISLAQINEANQRKASSDKSSSQSMNQSMNASITEQPEAELVHSSLALEDKIKMDTLENKLDKLTELIGQQSREIRALRGAVGEREAWEARGARELAERAALAQAARSAQALEAALAEGWDRVVRVGEAAGRSAAQAAGMRAAHALEPLAAALQAELASKLSATDRLLQDNLEKLVTSKTVMEKLSASVSTALADMVRGSFREVLASTMVPAMEKAHGNMFRQLNHIFQQGAKEFAANTEAAARSAAERGAAGPTAALRAALERHAEALAAAPAPAPAPSQPQLTALLGDVTRTVLQKEMSWWREQARSTVSDISRVHSPAPSSQPSIMNRHMQVAQIQSMMSAGDVNGAFQTALSASDLELVMSACRAGEPARVFGPGAPAACPLKQHVLLSLVQQLAADMTRDTALKHRYLEEAIMNLDTSNPVTREHLPAVVRELQKQLMAFIASNPNHPLVRQLRMLLMATDSLLKAV